MATVIRVRRISNPRRKARKATRRNGRRRMTDKQIRHFGTRAQKAGLRRRNSRKRTRRNVQAGFYNRSGFHPLRRSRDYDADRASDDYGSRSDNKGFGKTKRKAKKKNPRRRRRTNPALVVTLGAMNPRRKRRKNPMARRRRKVRARRSNPRRVRRNRRRRVNVYRPRRRRRSMNPRRRRRRSNPRVVYVSTRRRNRRRRYSRRNPGRRYSRRRSRGRRRNPSLFGTSITSASGWKLIGGGITGVVAAKYIPTLLPTTMLGTVATSAVGKIAITGVSAVAAGWAAGKFVGGAFGDAVLFGGLMQTASVALNQLFPSLYSQLGIGLGDLMNGSFVVPQNPIRAAIPPPAPATGGATAPNARVTMNGLARAYGAAF